MRYCHVFPAIRATEMEMMIEMLRIPHLNCRPGVTLDSLEVLEDTVSALEGGR